MKVFEQSVYRGTIMTQRESKREIPRYPGTRKHFFRGRLLLLSLRMDYSMFRLLEEGGGRDLGCSCA